MFKIVLKHYIHVIAVIVVNDNLVYGLPDLTYQLCSIYCDTFVILDTYPMKHQLCQIIQLI